MKMLFNKKVTTKSLMTLHMADNVTVAKQKERAYLLPLLLTAVLACCSLLYCAQNIISCVLKSIE